VGARNLADAVPLTVRSMKSTLRGDLATVVRTAMNHELAEQVRLWQSADSHGASL